MKILLIHPPHHSGIFTGFNTESLSLETIAATVPDCDIRILDMRFDKTSLEENLEGFDPQVIGITGNTVDVYNIRRILKEIKQYNKGIITVVGGHHATMLPADFNLPFIDAIVLGMGEATFKELIETIRTNRCISSIKGLAFPSSHGLSFSEERPLPDDLDVLPFPRRDLGNKYRKHYKFLGHHIGLITTAKGCPFRCRFCAIWNEMKGEYITKGPEKILEELYTIPEIFVRFADGNTFGSPPRMAILYGLIKNSGLKKRYMFDVRSDTVVEQSKLLEKWREIGLEYVAIGLESIKDDQLRALNKRTTVEDNKKAIQILHDNDIKIIGQFMIDQDYDKREFENLLEFVIKNRIHLTNYNITTPYPGTPLFYEKKEELITNNYEYFDMFHSVLPTKLDRRVFFYHYADLFKKTYTFKRFISHKWNRLLDFLRIKKEKREDTPLLVLLVIKFMLLARLKHLRKAYIVH